MSQETGETSAAIVDDDNKQVEAILNANKHKTEKYWIVIFAKPAKGSLSGKYTLMKHIKPYSTKPISQVGQIVGEVDNASGTVKWEINMPQKPFNYDALYGLGGKPCDEVVVETTTIPGAYVTQ